MLALILIGILAIVIYRISEHVDYDTQIIPKKISDRLTGLWVIAHQGMRENRLLRAEKALLTILKIDEKNAPAYNRLGILYAKQKEYKDAIDCFEIASSIEPSASSLHNLGLIYYETENYQKAATAFEQALKLEDNLATRHVAYAKVQEKLGNDKIMLQELEKAVELEPNPETYTLLMKAYESKGLTEEADEIKQKLVTLIMPAGKSRRIMRPKRVVI
jgi:tetratricopeptide (TPR) repeat protein